MTSLNKEKLTKATAKAAGYTYAATKPVVDALFKVMAEELRQGNSIRLNDFFTFYVSYVKTRDILNLATGLKETYPPTRIVRATPAAPLKRLIRDAE